MIEFDLLDKKILNILIGHGRMEYSQIARLTGTSTERIYYRINRLFKRGIINDFKVLLNYKALGYSQYNLFIKLKHISFEIRDKWKDYFKKHPFAVWVGTCVGEYDYRVFVIARDDVHLKQILDNIDIDLGENIGKTLILHRIKKQEGHNFLTFKKYSTQKDLDEIQGILSQIKYQKKKREIKLDHKDLDILEIMCHEPKIKYSEIAKKMQVTPEDIRYRVKKINSSEIVGRYGISVNYDKMGLLWPVILVKITHKNKTKEFVDYVIDQPQTINVIENLGDWDMEITFYSKSIEEADKYLLNLRERFTDLIVDYQFFITRHGLKYPQIAVGIFDHMREIEKQEIEKKKRIDYE